ncbi:MAG: hypothetical protein OHK0024_16840 [Thalassobaculales bacterium]
MKRSVLTAMLLAGLVPDAGVAEVLDLSPIKVTAPTIHPSQSVRGEVEGATNASRSATYIDGSVIQNVSPVNKGDAVRYNATGLMNQPGASDRFGGGTKIRTFGDWGASQSIDGLPAIKTSGAEGGGYNNTMIPSIAIDSIGVLKGGRAVQYGDGTDGGVLETRLKSGRGYKNHAAVSVDVSSVPEALTQAEVAHGTERWDYYAAGNYFRGDYDREPPNLEAQKNYGGLGKFGYNLGEATRAEFMTIYDRSRPDIYRNNVLETVETKSFVASGTIESKLTENTSIRFGHLYVDTQSLWPARARDRTIASNVTFLDGYLTQDLAPGIRFDGSIGAQYNHTSYLRDNQWDAAFDDYSLKTSNALTFGGNLVINAGAKITQFNNDITYNGAKQADNLADDQVVSYELGASYTVFERTRLRANTATGFNRFYEKYGNFGTDALNTSGAGDEIVQSVTYEVGVNQRFNGGFVDVALYNTVQDNVPRRASGGKLESVEVNQTGLEIEALAKLTDSLTVSAGYTRVIDVYATRADGTKVNSNIYWDGQVASIPENQISLRLDYKIDGEWSVWGMAHHNTGFEEVAADGTTRSRRAFTRLDIGTAWQPLPGRAVRLRIENLLDEKDFGTSYDNVTVNDAGKIGRVFWIGFDYTL